MSEYIEFAVRVPKDEADSFIARFGKGNIKILGFLLGEEIVRCRDCKHYRIPSNENTPEKICWKHSCFYYPMKIFKPTSNDFCAWGERKEN